MERYLKIEHSPKLHGETTLIGAKNAVLVAMASTILTDGKSVLSNVPHSDDVIQMMQLLLQHGAQQERPYGCVLDTPLYTAVNNGHFEATKILLQHLKDTQVVSPYLYEKSLRCAIASGHAAITELLLEHGATAPNALFAAIYHKHPAVIDVLLKRKPPTENEYGRDFFFPSDDFDPSPGIPGHIVWPEQNRTTYFGIPICPLPLALTQRNMEITRQLLIGNADPEAECLELQSDPCKRFYQRPLFHAAQSAFVDATRALLAAGASMQEGTHTCCLGSR